MKTYSVTVIAKSTQKGGGRYSYSPSVVEAESSADAICNVLAGDWNDVEILSVEVKVSA